MSHPVVHPVAYISLPNIPSCLCFCQPAQMSVGHLIIGDSNGQLHFWNLKSWKSDQIIQAFTSEKSVLSAKLLKNFLLVQGQMDQVKVYARRNGKWEEIFCTSDENFLIHDGYCKMSVLPSKNLVAFATKQNGMIVGSLNDQGTIEVKSALMEPLEENQGMIMSIKLINENACLCSYESGAIFLWNLRTAEIWSKLNLFPLVPLTLNFDIQALNTPKETGNPAKQTAHNVSNGEEGTLNDLGCEVLHEGLGVAAGTEDKIVIFRISENSELQLRNEHKIPTKGISEAFIRKSEKPILVCGSWDSTIRLHSWKRPEKLKPLGALKFHEDSITDVTYSERPILSKGSTKLLCAASKDKKISFWNVYE